MSLKRTQGEKSRENEEQLLHTNSCQTMRAAKPL